MKRFDDQKYCFTTSNNFYLISAWVKTPPHLIQYNKENIFWKNGKYLCIDIRSIQSDIIQELYL